MLLLIPCLALLQLLAAASSQIQEPIDAVYTYVNGSDPDFRSLLALHADSSAADSAPRRFADHGELRHSLRSLAKFAPWVRRVFLVTNGLPGQVPSWLNRSAVTLVSHADIFPDRSHLPTFSSPAIESHLHLIPGLSQRFLYFNDDFFLGAPVALHDFVGADGAPLVYLSHQLPACAEGCKDAMLADLYCDLACNVSACAFDGGDCAAGGADGVLFRPLGGGEEEDALDALFASSAYEGAVPSDMTCAPGCSLAWVADGMCDEACKGAGQCGFDGGDCASSPLPFVLRVQGARTVLPRPRGNPAYWAAALNCSLAGGAAGRRRASSVVYHGERDFVMTASLAPAWGPDVLFVLFAKDAAGQVRFDLVDKQGALLRTVTVDVSPPGSELEDAEAPGPLDPAGADLYAASLLHTRKLFRDALGPGAAINNLAPAHMPHLIDKARVARLQARFPDAVRATSAHKFRRGDDVQYAFAYFTDLLLAVGAEPDAQRIWSEFVDVDGDGCLGLNELRTLAAMVLRANASLIALDDALELDLDDIIDADEDGGGAGADDVALQLPVWARRISYSMLDRFHASIWAAAGASAGLLPLLDGCITLNVLQRAEDVFGAVRANVRDATRRLAPAFRVVPRVGDVVHFVMMPDNSSKLLEHLDALRGRRVRFFALNDDTARGLAPDALRALGDFLDSLYPVPSRFERAGGAAGQQEQQLGQEWMVQGAWAAGMGIGLILAVWR